MAAYTAFAPAERAPREGVLRQHATLSALPFVRDFLDAVPNMAVVLNPERQIVFANRAFADYLGVADPAALVGKRRSEAFEHLISEVVGKRPGEAVGCLHAHDTEGGCGTTPFCRTCGAVNAIMNSQTWHALDVQECRLITGERGVSETALDFRVWAQPIDVRGETFTVFSMLDISSEKRREALERIFFHDVLNTAGGVKGLADLMVTTRMPESGIREVAGMVSESADQLIEEISAQRTLSAAESGDLQVSAHEVHSLEVIDRVIRQFHSYRMGRDRAIRVHEAAQRVSFVSDPVLLRRVLINLVKNALEAVPAGSVVTLGCRADDDTVTFTVHNATVIPNDVQMQIFQRSFSTKGSGRGLGTYSIKLLAERYLRGRAWFVSNDDDGTVFTLRFPRVLDAPGRPR